MLCWLLDILIDVLSVFKLATVFKFVPMMTSKERAGPPLPLQPAWFLQDAYVGKFN